MAHAETITAPSKKGREGQFLPEFQFDPNRKYMFQLVDETPDRELPVIMVTNGGKTNIPLPRKQFKPYHNIVLTSQIVWEGERRTIRYYDGCTSLFVEDQPKDKELIDQYNKSTKRRAFINGKFGVYGDDRMLLIYLTICSWNGESKYRTRTANTIFLPVDSEKKISETTSKLDKMEEAMKLAKNAKKDKMMLHAAYLGISDIDDESGNERTDDEMRILYREAAAGNPKLFIDSFGNKDIEIKYYIDQCLAKGEIKTSDNVATWGSKNTKICDISGLKSHEAISQRIFEFAKTEEGVEFLTQLKALYS